MSLASFKRIKQHTRTNKSLQGQIEELERQLKNKNRLIRKKNAEIRELKHTEEAHLYR